MSLSWFFHKGAAYGNGQRFDSQLRKDPHYRRFTGKPKHPNMGYLDVYAFDVDYVRQNGFDRQLMCAQGFIGLSSMIVS